MELRFVTKHKDILNFSYQEEKGKNYNNLKFLDTLNTDDKEPIKRRFVKRCHSSVKYEYTLNILLTVVRCLSSFQQTLMSGVKSPTNGLQFLTR